MKNRRIVILVTVGLVLGGYFLWLNLGKFRYPRSKWWLTLQEKEKEPYDISVFLETLRGQAEVEVNAYKALRYRKLVPEDVSVYLFVGDEQPFYNDDDAQSLYQFLEKGGQAFFIVPRLNSAISNLLLREEAREHIYLAAEPIFPQDKEAGFSKDTVRSLPLGFYGEKRAKPRNLFRMDVDSLVPLQEFGFILNPEWSYLNGKFEVLGYLGPKPNFIRIQVGKGYLYWNSNPLAFTNYHLLRPEMQDYVEKSVRYLGANPAQKEKTRIFLDLAARNPLWDRDGDGEAGSPLRFILSQPAFRLAWYGILLGGLAYMVFLARRRQRIIPLLPSKINGSLFFIRAIADLYLRRKSHYYMCQLKMRLFLNHIKSRYGIQVQEMDAETLDILARRSGVSTEILTDIFQKWNYIQEFSMQNTDVRQLADFHNATELFYKQSR